MTETEVKAAFAGFDPTHPFYRACLQLMDDSIVEETDAAIAPGLTDADRHFVCGGLAHAKHFRRVFLEVHQQAIVDQARELRRAELAAERRDGYGK